MKFSNIFLIVITSIITFIGLLINKFYENFIKANFIVKGMFHLFVTLLALRVMYWVAKPFIGGFLDAIQTTCIDYIPMIVSALCTPYVLLGVFIVISVLGVAVYCTEREISSNKG